MTKRALAAALTAATLFLSACNPDDQTIASGTPTANAGVDRSVEEGNSITLIGSGEDSDGTVDGFQWAQLSGPAVTLQDADTPTVSFTAPNVNETSAVVLQLTVTDNDGNSGSDTVTVTISNNLGTPSVNAGEDKIAAEGSTVSLQGVATDSDGNIVTHQWTQIDNNPAITINDSDEANASFTAPMVDQATTYIFRLTATDNDGNSASDDVSVQVTPVLVPPVANAGEDQTVDKNDPVTLDGSASQDPNGTIVNYQWQEVGGSSITIINADQETASFTAPDNAGNATYVFQLTVTDDDNQTDSDQTSVTVIGDTALPVAAATADQLTVAEPADHSTDPVTVTLDASGSSAEAGIASYSWALTSTSPEIADGGDTAVLDNNSSISPSFVLPDIHRNTAFTFTLTVTDNAGATATDTVTVNAGKYLEPRNRYAHFNQCFVMYATESEKYITANEAGLYAATEDEPEDAAKLWLRAAALGKYILYNEDRELLIQNSIPGVAGLVTTTPLEDATEENAVFTFLAKDDATQYPEAPKFHEEPNDGQLNTPEGEGIIAKYRAFTDPNLEHTDFTIGTGTDRMTLVEGNLSIAAADGSAAQLFHFEKAPRNLPRVSRSNQQFNRRHLSGHCTNHR